VKFCIRVAQQAVGIQIRFLSNVHASFGIRNLSEPGNRMVVHRSCWSITLYYLYFFPIFCTATMREPNKRKKIKYVVMTTAIISYAGLLLQQKLLQKHRHSHWKPHIDRKRAKVVNIRRCLGRTYFRRAYRMGQDKFDELAKLSYAQNDVLDRMALFHSISSWVSLSDISLEAAL
jgi:hypothetical protein